jgi:hypothetical protein
VFSVVPQSRRHVSNEIGVKTRKSSMSARISAEPPSTRRSMSMRAGWRTSWSRMNSSLIALKIAAYLIGLAQAQTFLRASGIFAGAAVLDSAHGRIFLGALPYRLGDNALC